MPITMYDDVNLFAIPGYAQAVAGYVNGRWANYNQAVRMFPKAHHLSIAVTRHYDADCLDIEVGDARPSDAPAWVKRQIARGIQRPVCYANRSTMPSVIAALRAAGIKRSQVRLWVADYTFAPHQVRLWWGVLPTVSDACQYTDKALGKSLDASICTDNFFAQPKPIPSVPLHLVNLFQYWNPLGGKWWRA